MIDQLIIGDKASFDDFSASLAERAIKMPKKKVIKETVPFSNVTYDFTKINGEAYWEERELNYTFEITADTPEKLEDLKRKFSAWIMNVHEEEIHDPFIPDYHFKGTYEDMEYADEEDIEKTTVTVTFMAYPYMISNLPKVFELSVHLRTTINSVLSNESSHPVSMQIHSNGNHTLNLGSTSISLHNGIVVSTLGPGVTPIELINPTTNEGWIKVTIYEEVF